MMLLLTISAGLILGVVVAMEDFTYNSYQGKIYTYQLAKIEASVGFTDQENSYLCK